MSNETSRSSRKMVAMAAATGDLIEREATARGISQSDVMADLVRAGLEFNDRCEAQRAAAAGLESWRRWALKTGVYR